MSDSRSALGVSIRAASHASRSLTTVAARRETAGASAGSGRVVARGAADWLGLAAAPTFAMMALLTGVLGGGPADLLCSGAGGASPLGGMVPMYVLMSAFHLGPWLKLVSGRQSGSGRRSSSGRRGDAGRS